MKVVSRLGLGRGNLLWLLIIQEVLGTSAGALKATAGEAPIDAQGSLIYRQHCLPCHGPAGDGEGAAAFLLFPKPRNFTRGIYKFTSTDSTDPPVDSDVIRVLRQGLPGTSMPSFGAILSPEEIVAVVRYVRGFEPKQDGSTVKVIVPLEPKAKVATDIAHGKVVYKQFGCFQCHGEDGMANTPAAKSIVDTWGEPDPPLALSYGIFKGGGQLQDVFRTILAGIKGTGMPGFGGVIGQAGFAERDFWDLAAYVLSMSAERQYRMLSDETAMVVVRHRNSPVPHDPWDIQWDSVPPVILGLHPLWKRSVPPPPLVVRATHNDQSLAILLEWSDATKDWTIGNPQFAPDAVAVQYPVRTERAPFIGMGGTDLKSLVRVWHWQAHRQERVTNHDLRDVEQLYPNMAVDWYPDELNRRIGERPIFRGNEDGLQNQAPLDLPAIAVNNPVIRRDLWDHSALEYLVQGFGTLTCLPTEYNYVQATGVWLQGRWRVVMQHPLKSNDPLDRSFLPGHSVWMALAMWDGFHGDRNGQKSVSRWVRFDFEE